MCEEAQGSNQSDKDGALWFLNAADQGNATAQYEFGSCINTAKLYPRATRRPHSGIGRQLNKAIPARSATWMRYTRGMDLPELFWSPR